MRPRRTIRWMTRIGAIATAVLLLLWLVTCVGYEFAAEVKIASDYYRMTFWGGAIHVRCITPGPLVRRGPGPGSTPPAPPIPPRLLPPAFRIDFHRTVIPDPVWRHWWFTLSRSAYNRQGIPLWFLATATGTATFALWRRSRSIPPGYCNACGYDLRGLVDRRCPECGADFDPNVVAAGLANSSDEQAGGH